MDATNISINQSRDVSINIEALQAIKKRVLSAVAKLSIFNFQFSIWRVYRKELRLVRTLSRMMDGKVGNMWIGGWVAACVYLIFIYA